MNLIIAPPRIVQQYLCALVDRKAKFRLEYRELSVPKIFDQNIYQIFYI
jgi:hypothetical protein